MATVNMRTGTAGNAGFDMTGQNRMFVLSKTLDFSNTTLAAALSGDTIEMMDIPAMSVVTGVWAVVETVMGSAATLEVGDGSDTDGFIDAINLNSAGIYLPDGPYLSTADTDLVNEYGVVGGKAYTSAGVLQGLLGGTVSYDVGVVHIYVQILRLTNP